MVQRTLNATIDQLITVIQQLTSEQYVQKDDLLGGSSLGMHIRHIYEFIDCAITGAEQGMICYDDRARDEMIQSDKGYCLALLRQIQQKVEHADISTTCTLQGSYSFNTSEHYTVPTTLERELAYNIEHAVHHMAIIKMACRQLFPVLELEEGFGVAHSTRQHQHAKD